MRNMFFRNLIKNRHEKLDADASNYKDVSVPSLAALILCMASYCKSLLLPSERPVADSKERSKFRHISKIEMKFFYVIVFMFGWSNAFCAGVPENGAVDSHEISLGYPAFQKVVHFKIGDVYQPEIHQTFFRIFVDYPSMRPTLGPRKFRLNVNTLEILVQAYPKYGTNAEKVLSGGFGASEIASENGYRVFEKRIGQNDQMKIYGYKNGTDDVIVSDPGSWSVRYAMTRGVSNLYQFNCHFSKNIGVSYRRIDDSVVKLLSTMLVE